MAKSEETSLPVAWAACVLLGLLTLVAGIAWPALSGGPTDAALEDASEFMAAGQALESASASRSREQRAEEMAAARERLRESRARVEEARAAPARTAFWLKVLGGLTAAVGAAGLLASRPG